jgi:hypothetical protein
MAYKYQRRNQQLKGGIFEKERNEPEGTFEKERNEPGGDFLRKEGSKRERSRNRGGFSGSQQLLLSLHRLEQRHRQPLITFLSLL